MKSDRAQFNASPLLSVALTILPLAAPIAVYYSSDPWVRVAFLVGGMLAALIWGFAIADRSNHDID